MAKRIQLQIPGKRTNRYVYFSLILFSLFLLTLTSFAQQPVQKINMDAVSPTQKKLAEPKTIDTIPVINGSTKNENGQPVGFASVVIKGTGQGTMADKDGNFALKLPPGSHYIMVSCIGYQMQTIPLNNPTEKIQVVLKSLVIDTTIGVVLVSKKSRKKKNVPITPEIPNNIKVYPNPLPAYATLNIEWENPVEDDQSIEIFDLRGTNVQKKFVNLTKKTSKISMQLSLKNPGDYLLQVVNTKTHKIFKTQLMVN